MLNVKTRIKLRELADQHYTACVSAILDKASGCVHELLKAHTFIQLDKFFLWKAGALKHITIHGK